VVLSALICLIIIICCNSDYDVWAVMFHTSDQQTVDALRKVTAELAAQTAGVDDRSVVLPSLVSKLESLFFDQKPTQVWYYLEVAYALLMPASPSVADEVWEFQV
jgi:hypothetical protein